MVGNNAVLTVQEFQTTKLCHVSNYIYNNIEDRFRQLLGDKASTFLEKHWDITVCQLSTNQLVDITDCYTII